MQVRRTARADGRGRSYSTEPSGGATATGRRAVVDAWHHLLRRTAEVGVVEFLRLVLVEDWVESRVLTADVEDVSQVLHLFRGSDPARDELLTFVHLLRELVLECRDLQMNGDIIY